MNAPQPLAAAPLPALINVHDITPSLSNPRKRFGKEAHLEMVASVKQLGVLQPILVRRKAADKNDQVSYEIVAGERRWRAAKDAGIEDIHAVVRDLTDVQVLEIQIIENLQREDVHPIEEAEGYERLMKEGGYSADQLADKITKSRAYIYARLKLIALLPDAREAFYDGKLNASTALLLARIPVPALQKKALKEITKEGWSGEPMSYRGAFDHIQRNYTLRLADATFKTGDAELVPAAGSCTACPKRSGNQPELFGDVKGADVCTDPKCFNDKREANYLRLREIAEKQGHTIIEGTAAKKLVSYGRLQQTDLINLDATCYEDDKDRTYRQILGKKATPVITLIEDERDKTFIEAVEPKALESALKAAGITPRKVIPQSKQPDYDAERKKQKEKAAKETAYRGHLLQAVREKLGAQFAKNPTLRTEHLTLIAREFFASLGGYDDTALLMSTWGSPLNDDLDDDDQIETFSSQRIARLTPTELCLFLMDMVLIGEVEVTQWSMDAEKPVRLLDMAKRFKLDPDAIRRQVTAKVATPPAPAAQAKGKNPAPATPEKPKAKTAAPTKVKSEAKAKPKTKAKANPAPASPANEPAAPVEKTAEKFWPFPGMPKEKP